MGRKILIAYASRRGSTREAAEAVAAVLESAGMQTTVLPAGRVRSLAGFAAVVLGTAIRVEKPLSEAMRFAARFREELASVPTALFVLCLALTRDTPGKRDEVSGWIAPLVEDLEPLSIGLFAGSAERERLGFFFGRILKKALSEEGMELGDYRDWEKIRGWAGSLPGLLK